MVCAFIASAALITLSGSALADLLSSGVDLGAAGRTKQWAVLAVGKGKKSASTFSGTSAINGDYGNAGSGKTTLKNVALIDGDVYLDSDGRLKRAPGTTVTGTINPNADQLVLDAALDASAASVAADNLGASAGYPSTIRSSQNLLFSTMEDTVVLKLKDFVLTNGATLTLEGTANTSFVINVSRNFSLASGKVLLAGDLLASNVLFNITGKGSKVSLKGSAKVNGIILAANRAVRLSSSSVVAGEVIGKKVTLSGASQVVSP